MLPQNLTYQVMQLHTGWKELQIIMLYLRESIPLTLLISDLLIKGFFVKIEIRGKKWIFCSSYNPNTNLIAETIT